MLEDKKDEELVELYRSGNQEAFDELYKRETSVVNYFSRKYSFVGIAIEDLLQEGYLGLFKAVNSYQSGDCSFKTYASTCIKNNIITILKKNLAASKVPNEKKVDYDKIDLYKIDDTLLNQDDDVKSEREILDIINNNLTKMEKEVFSLYIQGFRYSEIANKINKNEKSIDGTIQRVKRKVLKLLGK